MFIGIGNPIKSDDSVGLYIISRLRERHGANPNKFVRIESAHSGEAALSKMGRTKEEDPGLIIIFDAIESNSLPGTIIFANVADTKYGFFATHNLPLTLNPGVAINPSRVFVLGIQGASVEIGEYLTKIVNDSADRIVDNINRLIEDMD